MKIYLLKRADGGVSVMRMYNDAATVESELLKWTDEKRNAIISWREIAESDIPDDRSHREHWCDVTDDSKVDIVVKQ